MQVTLRRVSADRVRELGAAGWQAGGKRRS